MGGGVNSHFQRKNRQLDGAYSKHSDFRAEFSLRVVEIR